LSLTPSTSTYLVLKPLRPHSVGTFVGTGKISTKILEDRRNSSSSGFYQKKNFTFFFSLDRLPMRFSVYQGFVLLEVKGKDFAKIFQKNQFN
jgi:hypothetical protein